jgi:hypothetical protein
MAERDSGGVPYEADLRAADDLAAAAISEQPEVAPTVSGPPPRRHRIGPYVALACLVVVVAQLPAIRAAFETPPSIRVGATDTDPDTEACIDTLWRVSSLLQNRGFEGEELLEPLTHRPYNVHLSHGETVVECPNPSAHNLRSLHVSSSHRAPEARR